MVRRVPSAPDPFGRCSLLPEGKMRRRHRDSASNRTSHVQPAAPSSPCPFAIFCSISSTAVAQRRNAPLTTHHSPLTGTHHLHVSHLFSGLSEPHGATCTKGARLVRPMFTAPCDTADSRLTIRRGGDGGREMAPQRQLAVQRTREATRPDGRMTWLIHDLRSGAGRSVRAKMALWPFPKAPFPANSELSCHHHSPLTAHRSPLTTHSLSLLKS
jgi:hypothetical protein